MSSINVQVQTQQLPTVTPRPLALAIYRRFPLLQRRLKDAVNFYKEGRVSIDVDMFTVQGLQGTYKVDPKLSTCTCPDHRTAPNGLCKHILSAGLMLASYELAQDKPATLATRVFL